MSTCGHPQVGSAAAVKDSSLLPAAKQSSAVAMLVFSMTDRAGFNQLPECQAELKPTPCIAIATKCDLVQSWSVTMVSYTCSVATLPILQARPISTVCIVKADIEAVANSNKLPIFPLDIASGSEDSDKTGTMYSAIYQKILAIVEENLW